MLSQLNTYVTDMLGPMGPLLIVGALGFVMILLTLPILLQKEEDPLLKLKEQQKKQARQNDATEKLRTATSKDKLEKYSTFLEPQDEQEYSAAKLKLLQAGYKSRNAVRMFHFFQFALGILGLIGGGIYALVKMSQGDVTTQNLAIMVMGPGIVGYMLPKFWVNKRQKARQLAIENGFPDSLDMMLVCVEAGQSLDQSILRVSNELSAGFPELSEEFGIVSHEMKAGKSKENVLRDMAERCGVNDITSFTTVLIQSQQFGTSIADALRVYAAEMRDKRVMKAEEAANKLPTKMTLATMMLTVPPLLLILIGPSIHNITTSFGGG